MLFCYFTGYFTNDLASNPWPVAVEWEYLSGDRNQQSVSSPKLKKMAGSLIFEEVDWSDEQTYGCTARATCLGSEDCARPLGNTDSSIYHNSYNYGITIRCFQVRTRSK